jgi:hypothetical protein
VGTILAAHQACWAAVINYGSYSGPTVNYIDVSEESITLPLFGAPIFSGDSMDFNPVGFDAAASGSGASQSVTSRLTFTLASNAGYAISQVSVQELGNTTMAGSGSDDSATEITASGTLTVTHVDDAAVTPIVRPIAVSFTPSGGSYQLVTDGGGLPLFQTQWSGSLFVNVDNILTSEGVPFTLGATRLTIDLPNTLSAASEAATSAKVITTDFGIAVLTVPEPVFPLWVLAASGFVARRKSLAQALVARAKLTT